MQALGLSDNSLCRHCIALQYASSLSATSRRVRKTEHVLPRWPADVQQVQHIPEMRSAHSGRCWIHYGQQRFLYTEILEKSWDGFMIDDSLNYGVPLIASFSLRVRTWNKAQLAFVGNNTHGPWPVDTHRGGGDLTAPGGFTGVIDKRSSVFKWRVRLVRQAAACIWEPGRRRKKNVSIHPFCLATEPTRLMVVSVKGYWRLLLINGP